MINGAEILKETRIFTDIPTSGKIVLLVFSIVAFLVCAFFAWYNNDDYVGNECSMCLWAFGALFSVIAIIIAVYLLCLAPRPDRYEYTVLVNDQESAAKEIHDNYDVISINEDIWTIRDKKR